ncbi:MAG: alpha/beta fold hydrolase [Pseudomonadota bacterium]
MLAHHLTGPADPAPVVLYLHGLGVGGWCWEPVHAALPEYAALVPDLPGHADSAQIAWRSIEDTAARVSELVDRLVAGRPVHITGHSLGGYIGSVLVAKRPERFRSAVLSGFHLGSMRFPALVKLAFVAGGMMFRVPPLLKLFARVFGDEEVARRYVACAKTVSSGTIRTAGRQVVDFKSPFEHAAVRLPTLAIAADGEPPSISSMPARLERQHDRVRGVLLQGRDHLWPLKEPLLYADMLGAHIRAHP